MKLMSTYRPLSWLVCALLVVVADSEPALALHGSKAFITDPPLVVKIEGRKGTRIYVPDDDTVLAATKEEDAQPHEPTAKEKLDLFINDTEGRAAVIAMFKIALAQ